MKICTRWLLSYVNRDQTILLIPPGKPLPNPDKLNSIRSYEEHNRRVREVVPPNRLLVYDVRDGWEPLCQFLEVHKCPEMPFPKTNSSFNVRIATISSVLIPLIIILFLLFTVFSFGLKRFPSKNMKPSSSKRWKGMGYCMTFSSCILTQKIKGKNW